MRTMRVIASVVLPILLQAGSVQAGVPDFVEVVRHQGVGIAFALAFAGGVLVSLTPCVYPMIPITVAVFGARGASRTKAFSLSLVYVLGIATTYTALGVWAALTGRLLGSLLASPWVLGSFASLFTLLGLYMLGLFPKVDIWLSRPISWASRLGGAGLGGAFLMGAVAGVVFAPCVGPVLVGILAYVAATRDSVLGASLLFAFALGMGLLFLVLGTFSGSLSRWPRSKGLLKAAKLLLAAMVLAGALYFWSLVAPPGALRFAIAAGMAILAFRIALPLQLAARAPLRRRAAQAFAAGILAAGLLVGAGGIEGAVGPAPAPAISWRSDYEAARGGARAAGKPVLIDFTADWCIGCRELDRSTFHDARVVQEARRFVAVRLDATRMEGDVERIAWNHSVRGLPAVVFVDSMGHPLNEPRVTEWVGPDELLSLMEQVR